MNPRTNGYYWVKWDKDSEWEPAGFFCTWYAIGAFTEDLLSDRPYEVGPKIEYPGTTCPECTEQY